ncbi:MAG TPA: Ig-like domain-containing protein [Flavobacteriaceae bacterium]|nr:Ig-like domain-containing protein [Flavobacteriaceae bacterium]
MKKGFRYLFWMGVVSMAVISCAKRGSPTGGPRDLEPPEFVSATPENYSINFKSNKIRIVFDEYIKLKDPQRQILISPPMDPPPIITPMGSPRKYVEIEIRDTLLENTTYTVNFGQSIIDNNEDNPMSFFKYVFSTGDYIDSLSVSGTVQDAFLKSPEDFISVMLYRIEDFEQDKTFGRATAYVDSIPYTQMPTYISYTNDSLHSFHLENLEEGTYKLIALKDRNSNYLFDPETDKIGFLEEPIQIPTDSTYHLTLFKEILDLKMERPKHVGQQRVLFGYQGEADSIRLKLLSEKPEDFDFRIIPDPKTDTLYYWYKPNLERDSLVFEASTANYRDTLTVSLLKKEMDTLRLDAVQSGSIDFDDVFSVKSTTPLIEKDSALIDILNKDSMKVDFAAEIDYKLNQLKLDFEKQEAETYYISLFPGAVTDFYGNINDTLNYRLQTKELSDYGVLTLEVHNLEAHPVVVQLVSVKGEVKREIYATEGTRFKFENIIPGEYLVRFLYDENKNGKWDTGNYLQNRQAERVVYYSDTLNIRANWDVVQQITD